MTKMAKEGSLRHNLVLFRYTLNLFGSNTIEPLRDALKREKETFDEEGRSYYFSALKGLTNKINENLLRVYDENIMGYLNQMNRYRTEKINLKYFQYLSILFTEIFLDKFYNSRDLFLKEINDFVEELNEKTKSEYNKFTEEELTKLAYWMATGSGKTLIMHINYLQFHRYNRKDLDNIILITPNESLSQQHLEELRKSGIPAKIFDESNAQKDTIQIIEIHKLTEEKKGEGLSVEVSSFEGNNLVFVDEGHKGFSGNAWKKLRDKISEIGFTFEYSATFDEAISGKKDELMEEYCKAIIMDYSYRHFYYDGFGKEFKVMNLKNTEYQQHKDIILLSNLLSIYQQIKYYNAKLKKLASFNFEKPLWIFVGNSVSSGNKDKFDTETLSDLQYVVTFFNNFLEKGDEHIRKIEEIFNDTLTLKGVDEEIRLSKMYPYIKELKMKPKDIYNDILEAVLNSESGGKLELKSITGSNGEIGLKVSTSKKYFALIYIGDTSSFKKKLEELHNFEFQEDRFSNSLFYDINNNSPINILIGSKKFIEGWNSFRVSSMGLLNMGRSKGSQIIQLFGRGVRLKGYNRLMKRSKALIEENLLERKIKPDMIEILETLNIFGIKADYVQTFKKQLEEEGVEQEVMYLGIKKNIDFINKKLVTMNLKKPEEEFSNDSLILEYNDKIPIEVDLRPKIEILVSGEGGISKTSIEEITIPIPDYVDFFDWDKIYFQLVNYKHLKGYSNLYFDKKTIKEILAQNNYKVLFDTTFPANTFSDVEFTERLAIYVLQKYTTDFYNVHRRKWATENLDYDVLREDDENFFDNKYTLMIDKNDSSLIKEVQKLISEASKIYEEDRKELPTIVFDRHLYQPLLIKNNKVISIPTCLNEGETAFIKDLRDFFLKNSKSKIITDNEFYIFRNLSKKGIGFFAETNNFYPDFILWILNRNDQTIVFIDPKGIRNLGNFNHPKIKFRNELKNLEKKLNKKNIVLKSYIISNTSYSSVKDLFEGGSVSKEEFEKRDILFQEDGDYIKKLLISSIKK